MNQLTTYTIGDSAVTADLGTDINIEANNKILAMRSWLLLHPFEGMKDLVPAYSTLSIYYDPFIVQKTYQPKVIHKWVEEKLQIAFQQSASAPDQAASLHRIPVCYNGNWGADLDAMAESKNMSKEEIILLHSSQTYRVFMIGFMPGFAYMGKVAEQLITPRKQKPGAVLAGSVGIAGAQTGIYPFDSPGGWNIIGRTPLSLFDPNSRKPVWMQPGDEVKFYPISIEEFEGIGGGEGMS